MEPILIWTRGDWEALLRRVAHYALVYQAGPKLPEEERAARHQQAHGDAVMLEEWAGMLRNLVEGSEAAREGVGAS